MGFRTIAEGARREGKSRSDWNKKLLNFGIQYLDEATQGILPNDLVILGAPSGIGKTQMCVNIAISNAQAGKRVHFFALEAREHEIEQRLKYQLYAKFYFDDPSRERSETQINYKGWLLQKFDTIFGKYDEAVGLSLENLFKNLNVYYKLGDSFDVYELLRQVHMVASETDLIIIDHLHYFDWEGDNDNKAIKEIVKMIRTISLELAKPIILVSHLRKKDRGNKSLAADLDEFHGSSELFKIATMCVTIGSGGVVNGKYVTYIRIPKMRDDGSVSRYLGQVLFNPKLGGYENEYRLGWSNLEGVFTDIGPGENPYWARGVRVSAPSYPGQSAFAKTQVGKTNAARRYNPGEGD